MTTPRKGRPGYDYNRGARFMPKAKRKATPMYSDRNAVAYIRVSTQKQEIGPLVQRAEIEKWAHKYGVRIVQWFEEKVSGATPLSERKALQDAITAVSVMRVGLIVVAKRDRLSRDPMVAWPAEALALDAGARIVTVGERVGDGGVDSPEAMLTKRILDVFAEHERNLIRSRTKAALAILKQQGRITGPAQLGKMDVNGMAVVNPQEMESVAMAQYLSAQGHSLRQIGEKLWRAGHRPRLRGATEWSASGVNRLVHWTPTGERRADAEVVAARERNGAECPKAGRPRKVKPDGDQQRGRTGG